MAVGLHHAILRADCRIRIIEFAVLGERFFGLGVAVLGKPFLECDFHAVVPPGIGFGICSCQDGRVFREMLPEA